MSPGSPTRWLRLALLFALAGTALVVANGSPGLALSIAPAFVLAAALIVGMFPGEALIDRMRERRATPVKRRRRTLAPRIRAAACVRPVGHSLAFALAMRPPPGAPARV